MDLQKSEEIARQVLKDSGAGELASEGRRWGYMLLGTTYLVKGDLEQGEEYLGRYHSEFKGTSDFQQAIWSGYLLGWSYLEKGDLKAAEEYLGKTWSDSVSIGLTNMGTYLLVAVLILNYLIQVEVEVGKLESARSHLEELKKVGAQTSEDRASAGIHDSAGRILAAEGDFRSSEEELGKALEVYRKHRDVYGVMRTLFELGKVYRKEGDTERATRSFEEVLETSRRIGSKLYVDRTLASLGRK
jgi:tetratricopeptide (TPR) repeat protein